MGRYANSTLNLSAAGALTDSSLLCYTPATYSSTVNLGDGVTFSGGTSILNGGTSGSLTLGNISLTSGTGGNTFNFNGGTLKASVASATFMPNSFVANVKDAGGIIDNGGYAITIAQVWLMAESPPRTAAWSSKAPVSPR